MPFCFAPWSNIDISPQGMISPCCKFRHDQYQDRPLNVNTSGISEYKESQTIQLVKKDFLQDKWPVGCDRCRIEEENSIPSKRQMDYQRWNEEYHKFPIEEDKIIVASVAFGNTCNLTCITCNPESSSRWQREHRALYNIDVLPNHFYRRGFVEELSSLFGDIVHLDIPGGEPFLSGTDQQQELLSQLIAQGRSSEISLHYVTNATVWPDRSWWELWSHFREVDLQISLDGIESRFEYIRYPADWSTVMSNVIKYQQESLRKSWLRLSVSHTVSAYNIYYLPEFIDWCKKMRLPRPWMGRVHDPIHMRPSVWSIAGKKHIIDNLANSSQETLPWINIMSNEDDSEHFDLFKDRLAWHDRYRNLDFATTFPEMAKFL